MDQIKQPNTVQTKSKACVCPFGYADGTPGFSVYDEEGKRIEKGKLGDHTLEKIASNKGLTVSKFPPKKTERT